MCVNEFPQRLLEKPDLCVAIDTANVWCCLKSKYWKSAVYFDLILSGSDFCYR